MADGSKRANWSNRVSAASTSFKKTPVFYCREVAPAREHTPMEVYACGRWWKIAPWQPK